MQDGRGGSDLRSYVRVLRRRKTYVILAVVAVTAGALGLSLVQSRVYEGTSSLLLAPKSSESLFQNANQQAGQSPSALAETQIELIQSAPVAQEVRKRIGIAPAISISQVGQTQVRAELEYRQSVSRRRQSPSDLPRKHSP